MYGNMYSYVQNSPLNWSDPWGLWKYYRNWGGPDWTAGQNISWDQMPLAERQKWLNWLKKDPNQRPKIPGYPKDKQDLCYMKHDIGYGEARMSCKKNNDGCEKDCFNKKKKKCDFNLSGCLFDIGISFNPFNPLNPLNPLNVFNIGRGVLAVPVFIVKPGVEEAWDHNKKYGTSDLIRYSWGNHD